MNYNTQPKLWDNWRLFALLNGMAGTALSVIDGHICENRDVLARFDSNEDAANCLKSVGFVERDGKYFAA